MFENEEIKKRKLEQAYWKGVEKARQTGALEGLMGAMADLVVPDSMGTDEYKAYKQGYRDLASGKIKGKDSAPKTQRKSIPLDVSEKSWYSLCDDSEFISEEVVRHYSEELHAGGHHVTFVIGLSSFTAHECPQCGERGYFKIRFLGRIGHPACNWSGYMGTGAYVGHQLKQIFHTGIRAGGSMKDDADRKGDKSGGWVNGIFAFLFVGVSRAVLAVVLIPLHLVVSLCQPHQSKSEIISRAVILGLVLAAIGVGIYEIQVASTHPLFVQQQASPRQTVGSPPVQQQLTAVASSVPAQTPNIERVSSDAPPESETRIDANGAFAIPPNDPLSWTNESSGSPLVISDQGPLQVRAQKDSATKFLAKTKFGGDVDITFVFDHEGFGRTTVGLWSLNLNEWLVWADLDTDDTACLYLNSKGQPTTPLCPSGPYLDRRLPLRMQVVGNRVSYYDGQSLLFSSTFTAGSPPYVPALAVSSVAWKGGDNRTTFFDVQGTTHQDVAVANPQLCAEEGNSRSPNAPTQAVEIKIINQRPEQAKLYWLNQMGQRVFYAALESGFAYTQPTYADHAWVVTDRNDRCTMFFLAQNTPHQEVTIR